MSRRSRIPAPFQKVLPSIIRGAGPRLFLVAAGCAALLLVGGSSYLISHSTPSPAPAAQPKTPLPTDTPASAEVLGTETPGASSDSASKPAGSAATGSLPAASSTSHQHSIPDILPCTTSCSATSPTAPVQSPVNDVTKGVAAPVQGVLDLTRQLLGGL